MVEIRVEPLAYLLMTGLPHLAGEAHAELEHEHREVPYSPDWEAYQRMEDESGLRFFSLREDKNLIGYAAIIIDTDIHRDGLMIANFRDIFVTKTKRGHAAKFVKAIERILRPLGVKRQYVAHRLSSGNNADLFYKALGFEQQEVLYAKTLH